MHGVITVRIRPIEWVLCSPLFLPIADVGMGWQWTTTFQQVSRVKLALTGFYVGLFWISIHLTDWCEGCCFEVSDWRGDKNTLPQQGRFWRVAKNISNGLLPIIMMIKSRSCLSDHDSCDNFLIEIRTYTYLVSLSHTYIGGGGGIPPSTFSRVVLL